MGRTHFSKKRQDVQRLPEGNYIIPIISELNNALETGMRAKTERAK